MKRFAKGWRRALIALAAVVAVVAAFGYWGVSALISGQLHARYGGRVTFSGWHLGASSSSLGNLALGETNSPDSPVWAEAERVETDLTLGGILRGRLAPTKIILFRPRITFRVGADGKILTRPPLKSKSGTSAVPSVEVHSGRVTIKQEGRPAMIVEPVRAMLSPGEGGEILRAETDSDFWGKWTATGKFATGFGSGAITLASDGPILVDAAKTARLPFVPAVVWEHVRPRGPVKIVIDVVTGATPSVVTRGEFLGKTLDLPTLGLTAEGATGRMTIADGKVTLDDVKGRALGGQVAARGTLDFGVNPPKFDLALDLKDVDVTRTPKSWRLDEAGITGRLTGSAHLRIALTKEGPDFSGTEGSGVVEEASLGGVAVKSLKLAMRADGDEIQYEAGKTPGASIEPAWSRFLCGVGLRSRGRPSPRDNTGSALLLIALQSPPRAQDAPTQKIEKKPPRKPAGFVLPKSLTTQVEFDDVDLVQIIAKARGLGIPLPFTVSGRLSLKAKATIPLGALRDVRGYAFHGQATLKAASIAGVDLGAAEAKVDLENGVLDLSELRGQFVDRPAGSPANPPPETDLAPGAGPLRPGGFRGRLHAVISPPGEITAHLEGAALPLGEVAAPLLPSPSPLSGSVSMAIDVAGDAAHLDDPRTWSVSGRLAAAAIRYRDTVLNRIATTIRLKDGNVSLPDLAASLGGHPLKARLALGLVAPYAVDAELDAEGWDLDALLAFVPSMPRPAPVGGRLTIRVAAKGTLDPPAWTSDGDGLVEEFRAGPVAMGDLPIRWRTEADRIRVTIANARSPNGSLAAEAEIPTDGTRSIRGTATFSDLDVKVPSALIPGSALTMTGRASGKGTFVVRPIPRAGEAAVEGTLNLAAPDLTVQGVAARSLRVAMKVANDALTFEAHAETLGGTLEFAGNLPMAAVPPGAPAPEVNGSLRVVGFRLEGLWKPLGLRGAVAKLEGLASINANLRMHVAAPDLRVRGLAEVRDLRWGRDYPVGTVKGTVTVTPAGWTVEPMSGDILGGSARGSVAAERPSTGPQHLRFDLQIDRASLKRVLAFLPDLAAKVDGRGTLRMAGRMADTLRADGELYVPSGTLLGLPVSELRAPAGLEFAPNGGLGSLRVRRWTARFAGGRLTGDARFGLGADRSFQLDNQIQAVDIESTLRVFSDARKPASGKVSGKIVVSGPDLPHIDKYRGRIDLEIHDASLFELPVFRQLERFLGATRGGVFEDGEIHASIGNRQIQVDSLTLTGRLVQLHASGTVGFDGRLDLAVLINTNQVIGQTGQALARIVPAVTDPSGRRAGALPRFASFLSNRLLKFRVTGTLASPSVDLNPAVAVGEGAVGFFAGVLKLPLELLR